MTMETPQASEVETSEFEKDLYIDPTALDVEWLEQPQTFFKYAKKLAKASRKLDRLKQREDVIQARADSTIRSKYTDKKPTEVAIRSELLQDEVVITIARELIDQKYEVDLLISAVRSFDQRKAALENLVRLQAQNYFASPKEPRNLNMEYEKRALQNETRSKIAASVSRRK